ncbi:MAG: 2-oxoisovalerate dehydrogenase [Calditrichia bacterium]
MNELIFIINESPEGGFEAKALDHPIFTEADTVEQLKSMIKDSVRCHFEPGEIPKIIHLHFVKEEIISS